MIDDMREIEVVVALSGRVTVSIGDVFLTIDTDQARIDREVGLMAKAPMSGPGSALLARRNQRSEAVIDPSSR
jgi:hypothetical protein